MSIGAKLTAARKNAGMTQERLAERLEVTPQAISTWERNENLPDTRNLIALGKILGVSLDDLVSEEEPPSWELRSPTFNPEHMYTYIKAKAQAAGLTQTLAALPFMRRQHEGQLRSGMAGIPYAVHPLTLACHAMAMGLMEDDVIAAALLHDVVEDTGAKPQELPVGERVREERDQAGLLCEHRKKSAGSPGEVYGPLQQSGLYGGRLYKEEDGQLCASDGGICSAAAGCDPGSAEVQ